MDDREELSQQNSRREFFFIRNKIICRFGNVINYLSIEQ